MFRFRELSINFVCAAPKPCSLLKLTFAKWFGSLEINDSILSIRYNDICFRNDEQCFEQKGKNTKINKTNE